MDKEFWHRRWEKNEIGFHLHVPHRYLQRFFSVLLVSPGAKVFVPLSGKSPDLVWLCGQGLTVIGIELSRVAVEAFFSENDLPGEWTTVAGMPCCHADGYQIFWGDFFQLPAKELTGVSALYDRGSLVALPPEMRTRYAAHLATLLPSGSRMLLIGYEYNQAETDGPPFSVPRTELEDLFRGDFRIEQLTEDDALWSHQGLAERGVTKLTEYAVLLIRN
jgi:thiopurine S-methyltransferase